MTLDHPDINDGRWTVDTGRHVVGMDCTVTRLDEDGNESAEVSGMIAAVWLFRGVTHSRRRRTQRRRRREHSKRTCQLRLKCMTAAPSFKVHAKDIFHSQDRSTSTRIATRLRTRSGGTLPCSGAGHVKLSPTGSGSSAQRISRGRRGAVGLPSPTTVDTTEPLAGQPSTQPWLSEVPCHV